MSAFNAKGRSRLNIVIGIQDSNQKHAGGGPEASRLTATARKKLTALGIATDALRDQLEARELINM